MFSVLAFSQLQLRADCLPQEHLAWEAQTQASSERPQQVVGFVISRWLWSFGEGFLEYLEVGLGIEMYFGVTSSVIMFGRWWVERKRDLAE